jgi:hypothetical protein
MNFGKSINIGQEISAASLREIIIIIIIIIIRWHYSPKRTFSSLTDFSQAAPFFDFSYQVVILHLFITVCIQFHHLFLVFHLVDVPEDYC